MVFGPVLTSLFLALPVEWGVSVWHLPCLVSHIALVSCPRLWGFEPVHAPDRRGQRGVQQAHLPGLRLGERPAQRGRGPAHDVHPAWPVPDLPGCHPVGAQRLWRDCEVRGSCSGAVPSSQLLWKADNCWFTCQETWAAWIFFGGRRGFDRYVWKGILWICLANTLPRNSVVIQAVPKAIVGLVIDKHFEIAWKGVWKMSDTWGLTELGLSTAKYWCNFLRTNPQKPWGNYWWKCLWHCTLMCCSI